MLDGILFDKLVCKKFVIFDDDQLNRMIGICCSNSPQKHQALWWRAGARAFRLDSVH